MSFNFVAAVTVHSDFGAQENKICHCFCFLPIYLPWSDGTTCHDLSFVLLSFKPAFSLSSFTLIKTLFSSSSLSAIRVVLSAYLRLLSLPTVLIPAYASSSWHFTWCILHINYISRVTIYSLDILLSQFWTSLLFHVQDCCFLMCIQVSQETSSMVFPYLSRIFQSLLWSTWRLRG